MDLLQSLQSETRSRQTLDRVSVQDGRDVSPPPQSPVNSNHVILSQDDTDKPDKHSATLKTVEILPSSSSLTFIDEIEKDDEKYLYLKWNKREIGRNVSRFWIEKALLFFTFLQIAALIQESSGGWGWPAAWEHWTGWIVIFNLDVFALQNYQLSHNYLIYAVIFYSVVFGVLLLGMTVLYITTTHIMIPRKRMLLLKKAFEMVVFILDVLYIPLALVSLRVLFCQTNNEDNVLVHDSSVLCWQTDHLTMFIISSSIVLVFLIAMPLYLTYTIRSCILHHDVIGHVTYVEAIETLFSSAVSDQYRLDHFAYFSSFTRPAAYFTPLCQGYKLCITVIVVFLRDYSMVQSGMWLGAALLLLVFLFFKTQPFRCLSTTFLIHIYVWCIVFLTVLGILSAGKVESVWLLPSSIFVWLILTFIISLVVTCLVCILVLVRRETWPGSSASGKKFADETQDDILPTFSHLRVLRRGMVIYRTEGSPAVNMTLLSEHIAQAQEQYQRLSAISSPLVWVLGETLEGMVALHKSVRRHAYIQPDCELIREHLPAFIERLKTRQEDLILVHPEIRKILLFLFAARVFANGKRFESCPIVSERESRGLSRGMSFILASALKDVSNIEEKDDALLSPESGDLEDHDEEIETDNLLANFDEQLEALFGVVKQERPKTAAPTQMEDKEEAPDLIPDNQVEMQTMDDDELSEPSDEEEKEPHPPEIWLADETPESEVTPLLSEHSEEDSGSEYDFPSMSNHDLVAMKKTLHQTLQDYEDRGLFDVKYEHAVTAYEAAQLELDERVESGRIKKKKKKGKRKAD